MKRDCIGKSFEPITNFYFYNFHGYGHKEVDCKKPKFDSHNGNSIMFRNSNLECNERGRSKRSNDGEKYNDEKK